MKAILYCRVSTNEQSTNTSLPAQLAACQKKADELGAEVVAVFSEVESGGLYQARPQIQEALALIEAGQANCLIVMRLDRGGREVSSLRDIRKRIARAGGELIFADGLQFDSTPVGDFVFTAVAGVAELERRLIVDRTHKGTLAAIRQGRAVSVSISPYGYHIAKKADVIRGKALRPGEITINESEAPIVRELFALADSGMSLRQISIEMQRRGYTSPKHGAPQTVKPSAPTFWSPFSLRTILTNPVYKGQFAYGKYEYTRDESRLADGKCIRVRRQRPPEQWLYIPCPAIVEPEQWKRVQTHLRSGRDARSGPREARHLLTGLLRCQVCGGCMAHRSHSRVATNAAGEKVPYKYLSYVCRDRNTSGYRPRERCKSPAVLQSHIEPLVSSAILYAVKHPRVLQDAFRQFVKDEKSKAKRAPRVDAKAIERELAALVTRERAVAASKVDAVVLGQSVDAYDSALIDLATRRRALEAQLAEHGAKSPAMTAAPRFEDFCETMSEIWSMALAPDSQVPNGKRNAALRQIIERVDWESTEKRLCHVKSARITFHAAEPGAPRLVVEVLADSSVSVRFVV